MLMIYKKFCPVFISLIPIFFLSACGGGGSGGTGSGSYERSDPPHPNDIANAVHSFEIKDAEGFIFTGSESKSSSAAKSNRLSSQKNTSTHDEYFENKSAYKILADGSVESVSVRDVDGEELPSNSIAPVAFTDINSEYALIWFYIHCYGEEESDMNVCLRGTSGNYLTRSRILPFLARKEDSRLLDMSAIISTDLSRSYPRDISGDPRGFRGAFDVDSAGNLYFLEQIEPPFGPSLLSRIDVSGIDSGQITEETLQDVDDVTSFVANLDGNFVLYTGKIQDTDQYVVRIVDTSTGVVSDVPGVGLVTQYSHDLHRASNGDLYVEDDEGNLYKISRSDGQVLVEPAGVVTKRTTDDRPLVFASVSRLSKYIGGSDRLFVMDGKEFTVQEKCNTILDGCFVSEMNLSAEDGQGAPAPEITLHDDNVYYQVDDMEEAQLADNYVWFFATSRSNSQDAFLRYNPLTESSVIYEELRNPDTGGALEILDFIALSSNDVYFRANETGAGVVLGKLDGDGDITIIHSLSESDPEIIGMEAVSFSE